MKVEGDQIRLIRVEKKGKKFVVDAIRSVDIRELTHQPEPEYAEAESDASEDVFGLGDEAPTSGTNGQSGSPEDIDQLDDLDLTLGNEEGEWLDMPDTEDEDVTTKVLQEVKGVLHQLGGKKVNLALVMPVGRTSFHTVTIPENINTFNKKQQFIRDRLEAIYNFSDAGDDQFRWIKLDSERVLVASCQESGLLLDIFERLNYSEPQTYFLRAFMPEEVSLMHFIKEPEPQKDTEQGSTVVIDLGKHGARTIFVKDGMIQSAMPVIPQDSGKSFFVNKVFSRIIMELEKGKVHYISQFVIRDEIGIGEDLAQQLTESFDSVDCHILLPGTDVMYELTEEELEEPVSLGVLGTAIAGHGQTVPLQRELSFIPKSIADRQKIFKLKWHGVLLLLLIAMVPVLINHLYQDLSAQNSEITTALDRQAQQITEATSIRDNVRVLDQQNSTLLSELNQLEELSSRTLLWTGTLDILNAGLPGIRNTWITSLQYTDNRLVIEGTTMYRERVPKVANLFHEAGVHQVTQTTIRERTFFNFRILVSSITDDPAIFDPDVEVPEYVAQGGDTI